MTFWVTASVQCVGYPIKFPGCNNGTAMQSHGPCWDRYQREGDNFLGLIVAMDETWARSYEPNLKRQPNEWKRLGSPRPKKVRPTQCAVKVMFIVEYENNGVILHHAVPPRRAVNAAYNCKFLQHHLRPALRWKLRHLVVQNPSFFMIMQGVTPLLLSQTSCTAGTSTVLTQCESMRLRSRSARQNEITLRGTRYNTRDELVRAIRRSIRNINKDGRADDVRRLLNNAKGDE